MAGTGLLLLLALAASGAGQAVDTPAAPPSIALTAPTAAEVTGADGVRRLSPDQADAAIEAGAAAHASDPDDLAIGTPSRGVHGELGVEIGTGGARAAYGAATVPIGDNAQASVAFETSRSPRLHGW